MVPSVYILDSPDEIAWSRACNGMISWFVVLDMHVVAHMCLFESGTLWRADFYDCLCVLLFLYMFPILFHKKKCSIT